MCRSLSRITIAAAFVLGLLLSTVPVQAQPRDPDSSLLTLDASWIDAALGWLEGLLGGGDSESLHSTSTVTTTLPGVGPLSGSCIDPQGHCGPGGGGGGPI